MGDGGKTEESARNNQTTENALKEFVESTSNGISEEDSDDEEKMIHLDLRRLNLTQNTQTEPSSFDYDDEVEDEDDDAQSDTDNTIVVMPGSVLAHYLTDLLTKPVICLKVDIYLISCKSYQKVIYLQNVGRHEKKIMSSKFLLNVPLEPTVRFSAVRARQTAFCVLQ
ncbi:Protein CBG08507 [Caenorhabditis briggsae]|uniref:Protein CBG08507 n=1 Tax=Caenorhabditis briggsae TaxID=6238 RepID=A8X6Q6_CAEBR|nr:Protein CBG08507 [Caenorhabditis briggsae]CAP28317.1 Protein CBG08507 [Caenorhabditis briggsae]